MGFRALEHYAQAKGLTLTEVVAEDQNSDYESGRAKLQGTWWRVRTARITPSKPGAFVAVWGRTSEGVTAPFSGDEDGFDDCTGLLVLVSEDEKFGVFTFTATSLVELGIYSSQRSAGKRGFRLYPPWSTSLNPQATRTQRRQAPFFERIC
ncbi:MULTISPECIES: MepB family protein [Brevibacterium]|uniref:Metallopeptidase n=1 Tax=Brevibacterium aurantiacum TaxID=273384 RepID=A0A2H1ILC4_BREAU|nr:MULTISPECIES: MepB family protein [Brevibacterium]SMX75964.1 hypothetical protein BAURA86_00672 [Brevibacterium aurantiacum]